jgi:hypothetical protein
MNPAPPVTRHRSTMKLLRKLANCKSVTYILD